MLIILVERQAMASASGRWTENNKRVYESGADKVFYQEEDKVKFFRGCLLVETPVSR